MADYFRGRIYEDPAFINSKLFKEYADLYPGIREEIPEVGGDFGFFDAKG